MDAGVLTENREDDEDPVKPAVLDASAGVDVDASVSVRWSKAEKLSVEGFSATMGWLSLAMVLGNPIISIANEVEGRCSSQALPLS